MKIVILGNDLRTLAMGNRLAREGCRVILVPGVKGRPLRNGVELYPLPDLDGPKWWQMTRTDDLTAAVDCIEPDLAVVMHVESSIQGLTEKLCVLARRKSSRLQVLGVGAACATLESSKTTGLGAARSSGLIVPNTVLVPAGQRNRVQKSPLGLPCVLKADGLAGGRGTVIVEDFEKFALALQGMPEGDVLVQEFVQGNEAALSLWVAGGEIKVLNINFEYKREFEGDQGLNTPGMGTVACTPGLEGRSTALLEGLSALLQSKHYVGPLDVSFMIPKSGPPVFLEFTTRFGDPEMMSELPLLDNVSEMLAFAARGAMHVVYQGELAWSASVIAKGGARLRATDGLRESLYLMDGEAEPVWCSSAANRTFSETLARTYAPFEGVNTIQYRRDIGHDVHARAAAMAPWAPLSVAAKTGLTLHHNVLGLDGN